MRNRFTILLLLLSTLAFAQVDTEFWFAAPRLTPAHWGPRGAYKLVIVAYDEDATVTVSQPAAGRVLVPSRPVLQGNVFTYEISQTVPSFRDVVETPADEQIHQTGLLIESTAPVGAYYAVAGDNSEVYTLKGRNGAGTSFVVPMQTNHRQTKRNDRPTYTPYCSIEVVATEDNTTITFVAPVATNYSAQGGTVHTVTLQRGETYAISSRSVAPLASEHLGGTIITSDKPILVNSTDDSLSISLTDGANETGYEADLVGEQLVPADKAGVEYIAPTNKTDHDYLYFFAADPTDPSPITITVESDLRATQTVTCSPGSPGVYKASKNDFDVVHATSDGRPFICFQLTADGTELSGSIMPALNCSGSEEVTYKPILSSASVTFNVITRTVNIDGFLVNGMPHPALEAVDFTPVPGAPQWSYAHATIQVMNGYASLTVRNTKGLFHMGALDGSSGTNSYGFFSNFGQVSLFAQPNQPSYTVGDNVEFILTAAGEFDDIHWYKGSIDSDHDITAQFADATHPVLPSVTAADAGRYIVTATHREGCPAYPDTFYVTVLEEDSKQYDLTACAGSEFALKATGVGGYTWLLNEEDEVGYDSYLLVAPTEDVTYTVEESQQGVSRISWTDTDELQLPDQDSLVLWKGRIDNLIPAATYCWHLHFQAPQNNAVAPQIHLYVDDVPLDRFVVPNGSRGVDTTYMLTLPAGRDELYLRVYVVSPRHTTHLRLSEMTFVPKIMLFETFWITVDAPITPVISFQQDDAATATVTTPFQLLKGHTADLTVTSPAATEADVQYRWSNGETADHITISEPGTYAVNIYRGMCEETATIEVEGILPAPECPEPKETDTLRMQICDTIGTFRWRGKDYTATGRYRDTLRLSKPIWDRPGEYLTCDSLYFTLELEVVTCPPPVIILPDPVCPDPIWQEPAQVVLCDTLLHNHGYRWRGKYYYREDTYLDSLCQTNPDGSRCVIYYYTLELTTVHCEDPTLSVQAEATQTTLCDDDLTWPVSYTVTEGKAIEAELLLDNYRHTFPISGKQGVIDVPVENLRPGSYVAQLIFRGKGDLVTDPVQLHLTINYEPQDVFDQLWDNVLAVFSATSGHSRYHEVFTAYLWYCNGQPLLRETTSQLYLAEQKLDSHDYYQVLLTRPDGEAVLTCPYYPHTYVPAYAPEAPTTEKCYENGRVVIRRGNACYDILGNRTVLR